MPASTSSPFAAFAATATAVAGTRSKLAKRDLLAAYLRGLSDEDLATAATFFAGRPLADPVDKLRLGWVQQQAALLAASGADEAGLRAAYIRHSDFGDAAAELLAARGAVPAGPPLTVGDVTAAFQAMSAAPSTQARVELLADLFRRATPEEGRFVGRIAGRETRIGLREGLLELRFTSGLAAYAFTFGAGADDVK